MNYSTLLHESYSSLLRKPLRTVLTVLGLIIGICSVVLLVALGSGAKKYVLAEFQSLGSNIIIIQPGKADKKTQFGPPVGAAQRRMTMDDVRALEAQTYSLEAISGLIFGTASIRYDENIVNASVFGSNDKFIQIINLTVGDGRFFSRDEDDAGRRVIVLGANIAKKLFASSPVGSRVKLNQKEFFVIGVLQTAGDKLGFNFDDFVFIPTRAAQKLFNDDKLFGIRAKAKSTLQLDQGIAEITEVLKRRRDGEEDFTIITQQSIMQSMDQILSMLTLVVGGIAAISLVVAGVGVMNMMWVSVHERTAEIGVRRALGARAKDIGLQFITEAVMLCFIGGCCGLLIGLTFTWGAYLYFDSFDPRPPIWVAPLALGVSSLVGIFFGFWPARRASKLPIVDCLRSQG